MTLARRLRPGCPRPRSRGLVRRQPPRHRRVVLRPPARPPQRLSHFAPQYHALVHRRRGGDRGADPARGTRGPVVDATPRSPGAVLALGAGARGGHGVEPSLHGLAGLLWPATVPPVERAMVLR